MKQIVIFWLALSPFSRTDVAPAQPPVVGTYLTEDKTTHVRLYMEQGKLFGKISWTQEAVDASGKALTDTENPDKTLRNRPIVGLTILSNFVYRKNTWEGGTIYDPESGQTYAGQLSIVKGNLLVKGPVLLFSRTETWTRIR